MTSEWESTRKRCRSYRTPKSMQRKERCRRRQGYDAWAPRVIWVILRKLLFARKRAVKTGQELASYAPASSPD